MLGISADALDDMRVTIDDESEDIFEVWPENWATVMFFISQMHRWRRTFLEMSGQVIYEGLRWPDIIALLREKEPVRKSRLALIEGLEIMEQAALPALNAKG